MVDRMDQSSDPIAAEITRISGGVVSPEPTARGVIPTGAVVGDYEVIGQLGAGGMGRVYRVRHLLSKRVEAMKIVLPDVERSGFIERFYLEIEVQARLNHPNICALHTAVRVGSGLALIMELADGPPITEALKSGPLTPSRAVEYVCQVLEALAHAHERGVVHRDVKPANIMISAGGQAKLVDFGIAKLAGSVDLTMQGIAIGSPYYIAPEVITGRRPDPRSDVYSAGVTLYEMVTGRRPVEGETQFAILEGQLKIQPAAPCVVNPQVPEALSKVILRALAKDPEKRFQTAAEFLAALRSATQPTASVPRRSRGLPAFVVVVAAAALSLLTWFVSRPAKAPEVSVAPAITAASLPHAPAAPVAKDVKPALSKLARTAEQKNPPASAADHSAAQMDEAPKIEEAGMESWGDISWTNDNGWYVRKGGLPALYPHPSQGAFVFTIQRRKGNARWVLRWRNSREYLLFEVDKHAFHRKQMSGGKELDLVVVRRKNLEKMLTLRIDVSAGAITHSLWTNGEWVVLDDWRDAGGDFTGGQFGFWPRGGDEMGVSNFQFIPTVAKAATGAKSS